MTKLGIRGENTKKSCNFAYSKRRCRARPCVGQIITYALMKKAYRIFRAVIMTAVILAVVVPAMVYVLLSMPLVQEMLRKRCETELSGQLGVDVKIDHLVVRPFNRASVEGVALVNDGDTLARVREIAAGVDVWGLISHGDISVNYASIIGLDARVSRDSLNAPLNIQPIIDRLSNKDKKKPPTRFDLRVNTVVIRDSRVSYDVKSEPRIDGRFDKNHILITGLRADASLPVLRNDDFVVDLKQMDFNEQSGFSLTNLTGKLIANNSRLAWHDLTVAAPGTRLIFSDGSLKLDSLKYVKDAVMRRGIALELMPGSHVYAPSLAPFVARCADVDATFDVVAKISASPDKIKLEGLNIFDAYHRIKVSIPDATVVDPTDADKLTYAIPAMNIDVVNVGPLLAVIARKDMSKVPSRVSFDAKAEGTLKRGSISAMLNTEVGEMDAVAGYGRSSLKAPLSFDVTIDSRNLDLGKLTDNSQVGKLTARAEIEGSIGRSISGSAKLEVASMEYRRHNYERLRAEGTVENKAFTLNMASFDSDLLFNIEAEGSLADNDKWIKFRSDINNVDFYALNLTDKNEGVRFSGAIDGHFNGLRPDRDSASIVVTDLVIKSPGREDFVIDNISLQSRSSQVPREITLTSPVINGKIVGDYDMATLPRQLKAIAYRAFPILDNGSEVLDAQLDNNFTFLFKIEETEPLRDIFKMPVTTVYPMTISGSVCGDEDLAELRVSVPYIRQGNKLIENTALNITLDGANERQRLELTTQYPSNDGLTTYKVVSQSEGNDIDTDISWRIARARRYDGHISLTTGLDRDDSGNIAARVRVNPGELAFNDSVWTIHPALITYGNGVIDVDGVNVSRENQFVRINGRSTADDTDSIAIDVLNVDLDYVFEAIGIDKFQLGGRATGTLYASAVLSQMPHVATDGIRVSDIAYNKCVLGNAVVKSKFDMERKAIAIDGVITQPNGGVSTVDGLLYPFTSELDFKIHADRTRVGFMEYYMSAFASDISGYGSGDLHLFGNFHDVDLEGDVFADNLKLKLNFTNTYFTATDSIHIVPGKILLHDVTLHDLQGHTGMLNGVVTHDFFRSPEFEFAITDVKNMLVYNETSRQNPDWYGKIYASGAARVKGDDNIVKIDIDVVTADNSIFTFVLSDMEEADEYTFLTFRDKATLNKPLVVDEDVKMSAVNRLRELLSRKADVTSARYLIELKVDITPQIEVDLVMDPVAGDKIRSNGTGNLRMVYDSADNDLRIFGTYRLDRGLYNFTLQDIIIKDFTIKEGSTISFTGDPLTARLNIEAYYSLNANLTDLDESFNQDKDLNRTNVPVHALLKVTGDIQQPEVSFDLEFPTLTSDIDRKVRSIVSTEEMMNRQIIYLLALNRFYTPDYMTTTKGNELFSVASSTISSQLSSMLGQLSDKWMISPNLRSDRGDFSDVEIDVALSSRLLNNRLLFNGNFGYRDKSLNTNQFIGDFDIEYLLNKSGSIRLRAYNHFNDQNYYVRTANTTQGVGVMFKHDFDNILGFLRRVRPAKKSQRADDDDAPVDDESSDKQQNSSIIIPLKPTTSTDSITSTGSYNP